MTPGLSRRVRHARLYIGGPKDSVHVDLHWSLVGHAGDARAPHRSWLERSARGFPGEPWRRLTPTAHLLYLAAHMKLQHYDEELPLLWLVDFHLLATTRVIDWDELRGDAARFGWSDAVAATAADVRERLGVALPPVLARVAASPRVALHRPGARAEPERVWNELRTLSWRGRLSLFRAYLFPSACYIRFRYPARPSWSWPLGYVKRWYRLVARGAAMVHRGRKTGLGVRPLLASRPQPTAQL